MLRPKLFLILISSLLFISARAIAAEQRPIFRAGAATSNITPWLGLSINGNMQDMKASHIEDDLHASCLVLDDGGNRLALVVVDSCMLPREIVLEAKRLIREQTGLPPDHVLISATHTHSAAAATGIFQSDPDREYQRFLTVRITDGVRRAVNNLAPAKIGWGSASLPGEVFNRRWKMRPSSIAPDPFGGTNDLVRMNPPIADPNLLEPAGPIDPQIFILSVQSPEGRPIALLANYSLHYCGGVSPGHVSADYFGMFADRIQQLLGADRQEPPFVGIMSNGTSGDINNINFRGAPNSAATHRRLRVANAVAVEVFRVYPGIAYHTWVALGALQGEIQLGARLPSREEVERARQIVAQVSGRPLRHLSEIYARETVLLNDYPAQVPLTLQVLRLGDLRIAAIPCEVFAEIGLELKQKHRSLFTISLANGYNGYLPTVRQHQWGGYETWRARSSYLEIEAAPKIVRALEELLGQFQ